MTNVDDPSEDLPEEDVKFLTERYPNCVVRRVGEELHVLLRKFQFPEHYSPRDADLLLRLPAGYPNAAPDMFWTRPDVKLASGAWPAASEHHEIPGAGKGSEVYENIAWQRWSRHFEGGWVVGAHGLQSFVRAIVQELSRGI
jgi:hypothetical protein